MSNAARKTTTNAIKVVVDPAIQQTSLGSASQSSLIIEPPFLMTQAAALTSRVAETTAALAINTTDVGTALNGEAAGLQQLALQTATVNAAPVVTNEYLTVTAGVPITGPAAILLSNDSDIDGDTLTILRYGQPAHGVLLQNPDDTISYTANANFSGADSFTYTVSDGQGNETIGTVYLTVQGTGNQAPVVQGESVAVQAGVPATGTPALLLANDTDPDGDTLTIARYGQPAHGTLTQNSDGTITYTANANFSGTDSFTYVVSDGQGNESTGTVTLAVAPAPNTAPTAVNDSATVSQDGSVSISVLSNDTDPESDSLSVSTVGNPANGTATLNADGRITYVPKAGFTGTDSFSYTIADGKGGSSTAQVTVTVQASAPDMLASADSGSSNSDNITSNTRPGFTIPAPPAGSVAVLLVDGVAVAATYNATAKTLTPTTAIAEGEHQISYGYKPSAGGALTLTSGALSISIDAVKETPGQIDLAATSDSGGSTTDNLTNVTKPVFNVGPLPKAGDVFNLYVNNVKVAATYDAAAGTLTPTTALSATTHSITHSVTNAAGVESARSPALSLVIDTTAPTTYLNSFASKLSTATDLGLSSSDGITSNNKPSLSNQALTSGYFSEAGAVGTADLFVDGVKVASVWDKVAGTLTPVNALTDGPHTLSFTRTDSAGNETTASTQTYRITVDTSTPVAPTLTPDLLATADSGASNTDNITSSTRPGFVVGSPLPGGRIDLLVDGVVVAATYTASTKTLVPNVALSEGSHTIAIVNVSAAGAQSAASPALTIDVDAVKETPTLIDLAATSDSGGSTTDNLTNVTKPVFNVGPLPKAGDVFNLYVDNVKVAATYDAAAGTLTPNTALSATTHSITHSVTNAAGVESARSPALSLVIDTTAPTTYLNSFASKLSTATDLGLSSSDGITSNNKPSLYNQALTSGYFSEAGAVGTADLFVDGVKVASVWDKVAGTLTPVNALTDGPHTLSFTRTDSAGNETTVSTQSTKITVDTSTPVAPTLTPDLLATADSGASNSDNITSSTRPGFVVGSPLPGGRIDLLVDGIVVAATYTASTKTLVPNVALSEGSHTIAIVNVSAAGAQSAASPALTIDVDAVKETPPLIDLAATSDSGGSTTDNITKQTRPVFNVGPLPKAGDVFNLYVDNVKVAATYDAAAGTLTPNTALSATTHSITHSVTNAAGVESARSPALSLVIDTTAPTTYLNSFSSKLSTATDLGLSSSDGITSNNKPSLYNQALTSGYFSEAGAVGTADLFVDGVKVASVWDKVAGTLTPVNALTDGPHTLSFTRTDSAGNETTVSAQSTKITVDTSTPVAPTLTPDLLATADSGASNSDNITSSTRPGFVVGSPLPGGRIDLLVDGIVVAATYTASTKTLVPNVALSEGSHTIAIVNVSAAGAQSAASPGLNIDIDAVKEAPTTAPDLADGSDSGTSNTDNITKQTRPVFNVGPLPKAGDVFNLYVDNVKVAATYDAAAGTLTPNAALTAATHTITVSVTSAAGIESARTAGLSMTIDTAAPVAPAAPDLQAASDTGSSSTDNITANNLPSFTLGTVAATDSVSLWVDGVELESTFDRSSRTITPTQALADGVHMISVKVMDAAGNLSPASVALKVDIRTQAPVPVSAPDLQATSDTAGANDDDLTSVNQPVFNLPLAPASCTAVLYVDGLRVDATYSATAKTIKPTGVLSEGNHLITYAWVDSATGAESQLSPPLPIRIAFNPVVAGSDGNDTLVVAVDSDETLVNRNLGSGVTIDAVSTPTADQAFVALGGNDLVEAGDGADWVDLGATGSNAHSGTGAAVTTANVAQTVLMSEEDWKMVDSFGNFATGITANSATDAQPINGWANVANGGWGQDVVKGGAGVDLIYGSFDNDYIDGGAGIDGLRGGNGDDTLIGGAGNDVLRGDDGSDTFYWRGTDKGNTGAPEVDQITDFAALTFAEGGDVLDLRDLLSGEAFGPNGTAGNLANYLEFDTTSNPGSTLIHVSSKGQFSNGNLSAAAEDLTLSLNGVDLRSAMDLTAQATDAQLIEELLKRGNLIAGG